MKVAGRVFIIIGVCILLSFVFAMCWVFIGSAVQNYHGLTTNLPSYAKTFSYKMMDALQVFVKILPSVLIVSMVVGFSWAFGKYSQENPGRFSKLLVTYIENVFFVGIICTVFCFSAKEIVVPITRTKQKNIEKLANNYTEYVELAKRYQLQHNYETAALYADQALKTNPEGDEEQELRQIIQIGVSSKKSLQKPPATHEEDFASSIDVDATDSVVSLLQKAKDAYAEKRYFDAHYYASLAVDVSTDTDLNRAVARRLSTDAWNKLSETDYEATTKQNKIFAQKKDGYSALIRGENTKAYYLFLALHEAMPFDPDVERYFEIAKNRLDKEFFYIDETENLLPFEQYRNVYFALETLEKNVDVFYISGITVVENTGNLTIYMRGFSVFTYSPDGEYVKSFSVPYAKVSAQPASDFGNLYIDDKNIKKNDCVPYAKLVSLDRTVEGKKSEPSYYYATPEMRNVSKPHNYYVFNVNYNDLLFLCRASKGSDEMTLGSLLKFAKNADHYGFSSEVFQKNMLMRITFPFLMMLLLIFASILGWNYRLQKDVLFKFKWLFFIPILTVFVYAVLELVMFIERFLLYMLINLTSSFAVLMSVSIGVCILMLIIVSFWFISMRGE